MSQRLAQMLEQRIGCPVCGASLKYAEGAMLCLKCASRYLFGRNQLELPRPHLGTQYGEQYASGAEIYEKTHALDERFSVGVARTLACVLKKYTMLPVGCILEVGCGTGVLTRGLVHVGVTNCLLATDLSVPMLRVAAQKDESDSVAYFTQDVHTLSLKDRSVDVVIGLAVLHHLTHLEQCLREIYRVLSDGGIAVFQEPFYYGNQFLVWMIKLVVHQMKSQGGHSRRQLAALKGAIESYSDNLRMRHENRRSPEALASMDDKHLFIREDFRSLAKAIGFARTDFVSPWLVSTAQDRSDDTPVWKPMVIEILEALKKEAHLACMEIDYAKIAWLEAIDRFVGRGLLKSISPQEIIVLQK